MLRIYVAPLTTARTSTVRLLQPFLAGGIGEPISAHSSSVKSSNHSASVIPRRVLQLAAPANRTDTSESQVIHPTRDVPGWTLYKSTLRASERGHTPGKTSKRRPAGRLTSCSDGSWTHPITHGGGQDQPVVLINGNVRHVARPERRRMSLPLSLSAQRHISQSPFGET